MPLPVMSAPEYLDIDRRDSSKQHDADQDDDAGQFLTGSVVTRLPRLEQAESQLFVQLEA